MTSIDKQVYSVSGHNRQDFTQHVSTNIDLLHQGQHCVVRMLFKEFKYLDSCQSIQTWAWPVAASSWACSLCTRADFLRQRAALRRLFSATREAMAATITAVTTRVTAAEPPLVRPFCGVEIYLQTGRQ